MRNLSYFLAILGGVAGAFPTGASAQQAEGDAPQNGTLRAGYDYATGKYGTDFRASTQTTRLAAAWFIGDWTLDLNIPYLRRDIESAVGARGNRFGPRGGLIGASGRVPPGGRIVHAVTEGLGDVTTTASRYFYGEGADAMVWELGVAVKWDTGNTDLNLGSGARDYTLIGGGFKRLGAWSLGSSITYTFVGVPAGADYKDVWGASFDASYRLGDAWRTGGSLALEQSSVPGAQAPRSLSAFVSYRLHRIARLQVSANHGLSNASPAWGAGASLIFSY